MSEQIIQEQNKLKRIVRNNDGLINDLAYPFDENGRIIWRKLIKNEHLVANKDKTQETDVTKLDDKDILLLLSGFKELADIRGFNSINYEIINASPEFCAARCIISWIPSYESEGRTVVFESTADATFNNTSPIGSKYYLTTTAENRAFVRCVRNFLRIPILGRDEISFGGNNKPESSSSPNRQVRLLDELMEKKHIKWEHIVDKLKKEGTWKEEFTGTDTLPKDLTFSLIERIKSVPLVK